MEKVVRKFSSFKEAERADEQYYLSLTPEKCAELLLNILQLGSVNGGAVERSVRIYSLTEQEKG